MFRKIISDNKYFLTAYAVWLLTGAGILYLYNASEIFFAVNKMHSPLLDRLMTVLSAFGRGDTITIVFALLLVFPLYRNRIYLASVILFGLLLPLISYFSKDFFSKPRPLGEFKPESVHTVPWLENLYFDSFPSGHTMGAFGFFLMLNHFLPKKSGLASIFFLLLAVGCGYSRIYLGQHFFADVFAGSIIGVTASILILFCVNLFIKKNEADE